MLCDLGGEQSGLAHKERRDSAERGTECGIRTVLGQQAVRAELESPQLGTSVVNLRHENGLPRPEPSAAATLETKRRGGDSNPRYTFTAYDGLANRWGILTAQDLKVEKETASMCPVVSHAPPRHRAVASSTRVSGPPR